MFHIGSRGYISVESSVDSEDHFSCLLNYTSVETKVLLSDSLEGESIGFTCYNLTSAAFLVPVEGEIVNLSKFEDFEFSKSITVYTL